MIPGAERNLCLQRATCTCGDEFKCDGAYDLHEQSAMMCWKYFSKLFLLDKSSRTIDWPQAVGSKDDMTGRAPSRHLRPPLW
jgi:hypothetical protein